MLKKFRPRFSLRFLMAIPIACAGGIVCLKAVLPGTHWEARSDLRLELRIADGATSRPVRGATLQWIDPWDEPDGPASRSDDGGIAVREQAFLTEGNENSFGKSGRTSFAGWLIEIKADGFLPLVVPLSEYTGESIDYRSPPPGRIEVRLHPARPDGGESPPVAEKFTRCDEWGRDIRLILYGDKFYSVLSVPRQCSQHVPWFETEGGHMAPGSGPIRLNVARGAKVERIPGQVDDWHLDNLSRVSWGGRLYLVSQSQWASFVNAINQGKEPHARDHGEFFLRSGDEGKIAGGLPALPEPWCRYLLKEPVGCKVIEILPSGDARVNVGSGRGLHEGMELLPLEESEFSEQVVTSVGKDDAVLKTKYPEGRYRRVRVGDVVATSRTPR